MFEVNELYEYGRLESVVLGNFILYFFLKYFVCIYYIFYLSISFCSFFFFRMCQSLHY